MVRIVLRQMMQGDCTKDVCMHYSAARFGCLAGTGELWTHTNGGPREGGVGLGVAGFVGALDFATGV